MGEEYVVNVGLISDEDFCVFCFGVVIVSNQIDYSFILEFIDCEREVLECEIIYKWFNFWMFYWVIVICFFCVVVQGMDEIVVNGVQIFYKEVFGIVEDIWLIGFINGVLYLCCVIVGCWVIEFMNKRFGRRGIIFIFCVILVLVCFWQVFMNIWYYMFIVRFFLGFGIGFKSVIILIFVVECFLLRLRGVLVMVSIFFYF